MYSGLKHQSALHVHSNHISNNLLSSTGVSRQDAMAMNHTLDKWTDSLPAYFRLDQYSSTNDTAILFARNRLWWRFWNMKIILFRQFLLGRAVEQRKNPYSSAPSSYETACLNVAISAASNTISSISSFVETAEPSRLVTWYSIFFLFHASLVVALAILGDGSSPNIPKWQDELERARHVLRVVFGSNPLAMRCAAVLDFIVQPVGMPSQGADMWVPSDINQPLMDLSAWPTDGADPLTFFGWPE
jgi:transcriptional regulatory protein GAL4